MENNITRLQQLLAEVPKRMSQFSPEEMSVRPAPGKWSKKEIMGHLCDSALYNWQRFTNALKQSEPLVISPYPQAELVRLNNYQQVPTGSVISLWKNMNWQIVQVIKTIGVEKYGHPIQLLNGETKDLQFLVDDYIVHMEHHLRQIFGENKIIPNLPDNWKISVDEAMAVLGAHPEGKPYVALLENGNMYVEIYQPKKVDLQTPHDQDEIYVIISGSGIFYNNGERRPFGPGDLIFVPAGMEHRFEDFTDDFKTWVIFY